MEHGKRERVSRRLSSESVGPVGLVGPIGFEKQGTHGAVQPLEPPVGVDLGLILAVLRVAYGG